MKSQRMKSELITNVSHDLKTPLTAIITYVKLLQEPGVTEEQRKMCIRDSYMDENGNKVEYDETYYINGEEILLPQLTQEQVDRIVSFVESVNKRGYYNEAISNIISEEAGAYFSGQKSAKDVAGVIQSRVQVYVNENR